jgi:hypothetical protein
MLKKEEMEKDIKERLDVMLTNNHMISLLDEALQEWNGKMVSKRLATHVSSRVGTDYYINLRKGYSDYILTIYRKSRNLTVHLTQNFRDKTFSIDFFREINKWVYKEIENFDKVKAGLEHIDEFINDYNKIKEDVNTLQKKMEGYNMRHSIDWRDFV